MATHFPIRLIALLSLLLLTGSAAAQGVRLNSEGRLAYDESERGDRIPDFSSCGYAGGSRAIPSVPAKVLVRRQEGDATQHIQLALDYVAELPLDASGFRGAVQLEAGAYNVEGQLRIAASGVVLRGVGAGEQGTVILATGRGRRPLVRIEPRVRQPLTVGEEVAITQDYVPVGAASLELSRAEGYSPGDVVQITRPCSAAWVKRLGAKAQGVGWREGRQDLRWERTITAVDGNKITIDAPITTALDLSCGGGAVTPVLANGRVANVGVEDLALRSAYEASNPLDEEHSWHGVVVNHAQDSWVRRVRFEHFAGGAVLLRENTKYLTVEDCLSLAPVSELGGYRRHSFFTQGQQTLFLRCWAEEGLHDFAVGHCAAGPNAFAHCYAHNTHGDSGPLESWASGVLYDNVRIDGGDLFFGNRWLDPPGAGWSAANCVAWQCQAAQIHCYNPPGAQNWVIGFWAQPVGDGLFAEDGDFVRPISLFQQQTRERHGREAAERVDPLLLNPRQSTSPTYEQAQGFVDESNEPARTLRDLIEEKMEETASAPGAGLTTLASRTAPSTEAPPGDRNRIKVINGWLTIDGRVATGGMLSPTWWRGTIRPADALAFGPAITRFAPGRYGVGLTDELEQVVKQMSEQTQVAYDHHYGLWYERRRDDHLMVRRATAAVAPPFYEQPFARTGTGRAWDGLSRYDLTRYNPWYWRRLADFTALCDREGKVLIHQCYFQHNILEAGAHWADCPWRPTNNVNETGFSEPPPYIGDKRIFIAHQFYSEKNAKLRELHNLYLRQCVANFREHSNVIHMTSAEYTGPLEFTRFWIDTVHRHRDDLNAGGLIGLSATKDVQDAVLSDRGLLAKVDLIDIRYWCYDRQGGLYAPPGGANMAPRQHMRQWKPESGDFASVARAVGEYRTQFPDKPVTFSAYRQCRTPNPGWAVLMSGGSLANVPPLPAELLRDIVPMHPTWEQSEGEQGDSIRWLVSESGSLLGYCDATGAKLTLPASATAARYRARWIHPRSGEVSGEEQFNPKKPVPMRQPVVWLKPII